MRRDSYTASTNKSDGMRRPSRLESRRCRPFQIFRPRLFCEGACQSREAHRNTLFLSAPHVPFFCYKLTLKINYFSLNLF